MVTVLINVMLIDVDCTVYITAVTPLPVVAGNTSCESVVQYYLGLHANVVSISDDALIELRPVAATHVRRATPAADDTMLTAATNLILASYRNQLLHVFVRTGLVALAINAVSEDSVSLGGWAPDCRLGGLTLGGWADTGWADTGWVNPHITWIASLMYITKLYIVIANQ